MLAAKAGPLLIPIRLDVVDEQSIAQAVEVVYGVVGEGGLGEDRTPLNLDAWRQP